jgi:hypothetical protein
MIQAACRYHFINGQNVMSLNKPSESEEEYFAREEAAKRQREAATLAKRLDKEEHERLRILHYMKCPKCGFDLHETSFRGVNIDKCYHCGGIWFDDKELEQILGHTDGNLFSNIVRLFRSGKHPV